MKRLSALAGGQDLGIACLVPCLIYLFSISKFYFIESSTFTTPTKIKALSRLF
jgi:hypothetical protein